MHYYNENDPSAVAWLSELISNGHIPNGDIDARSIREVKPSDLDGYTQCHFFAGIGGWSLALRLAGWPEDREVWTGSCPCQPFSTAGKGKGTADSRHLWPQLRRLIRKCRPSVIFGEQVASKAGRIWFDGVRADLEALAYAVGGADLCAACISAPNIRQRLWWVAESYLDRLEKCNDQSAKNGATFRPGRKTFRVGDTDRSGSFEGEFAPSTDRHGYTSVSASGAGWMEYPSLPPGSRLGSFDKFLPRPATPWDEFELILCGDGKTRRIEPGTFPLAYGVSGRVGLLRGYGNAISPYLAAEFISAYQESLIPTSDL